MGERVAVVTDSTTAIPAALLPADLAVVPVHVVVDDRGYREGQDITEAEVAAQLRAGAAVSTSRPTPGEVLDRYRAAAEAGAGAVVSVHLSAELSGTVDGARMAARRSPVPVIVVDARTVAMAAGFAALDAAAAARAGARAEEVAQAARRTAADAEVLFSVHDLRFLRRGGRIGAAGRFFGTALRVKPILQVAAGSVAGLEKVRTTQRAVVRLAELAARSGRQWDAPRYALHHVEAPEHVALLRAELLRLVPDADIVESPLGAVIAVHAGPGAVGVVVAPPPERPV
jgi:DegV family protein with EDD domain